ncbi:MAG: tetratricopeptide repeat protein [Chthoniobacterales bacterium]|nr:tetratricopeptide repeat protein [Chthoniobacterales bacterium]
MGVMESRRPTVPAWAWGLAVAMVALALFLPAVRFPFFPFWDDDIHVHANPHVAQLSWSGIRALWSGPWQQLYIPLTYSVWAAMAAASRWWDGIPIVSGPINAAWFHGANVAAHSVSAVLVFVFLRRTAVRFFPRATGGRADLAAAVGAAIFALHPLQVEPVAWVSGLRDVLGGCLGLASLAVLFGAERLTPARWGVATLLFVASLAAKPAGVSLPLVAGILAVAPFTWPWRKIATALGPWLAIGAAWVLITSSAQWAAELAAGLVPVWVRPLVAADALTFYIGKALWPAALAADYGRSPDSMMASGLLWWIWIVPCAVVAALAAFKPLRVYLVPFGIFAAALLPTLGLVPFNFQVVSTVADRYAYFAMLGPALAASMILVQTNRRWIDAAVVACAVMLGFLSAWRLPLWSEDLKLFADTLAVNPESWKAMHNYASALDDRGRTAEAEPLMRQVIARRPDSAEAHNDLAVIVWKLGRRQEAVALMRRSLALRATPGSAANLARMEAQCGNKQGVIEALGVLVRLEPGNREAAEELSALMQPVETH